MYIYSKLLNLDSLFDFYLPLPIEPLQHFSWFSRLPNAFSFSYFCFAMLPSLSKSAWFLSFTPHFINIFGLLQETLYDFCYT